jgi:hypothetical protein
MSLSTNKRSLHKIGVPLVLPAVPRIWKTTVSGKSSADSQQRRRFVLSERQQLKYVLCDKLKKRNPQYNLIIVT